MKWAPFCECKKNELLYFGNITKLKEGEDQNNDSERGNKLTRFWKRY